MRGMFEAIMLVIGLIVGAGVGVYVGMVRGRRGGEAEAARLGAELAGLRATLEEVRRQLDTRSEEVASARASMETHRVEHARVNERLEAAREHFTEQRRQLQEMEKQVKDSFAALSSAALKSNNEQFITLAEQKLKPLREQLERYEAQIKALEKARVESYTGLNERLSELRQREEKLSHETNQLVAALRQSGAKGKWGEVTLQRIVELSGMAEHCDFMTQETQAGGGRPDLVVHLPGGRMLAVDAKVNTGAFLDAHEAADEHRRKALLEKFAADVRGTMRSLSSKAYWRQFSPSPEFVVMFMPGESFFATAVSMDRGLLVEGVDKGVLLASPTTLIALLLAVRHGWQQQQVAENAQRIAEAGRELYERLVVFTKHLDGVREGIERAAKSYDQAVGNWTSRTEPSARKLKELDVASASKELTELRPADVPMRELPASEESESDGASRRAS